MEWVRISRGSWDDLLAVLRLSEETHTAEGQRWCSVSRPQYLVYGQEEAVGVRLLGTAIVLVPERGGKEK